MIRRKKYSLKSMSKNGLLSLIESSSKKGEGNGKAHPITDHEDPDCG
jgi:hypothetical protein